ncbi:MAG: hypothetical protein L3K14_02245 [Thermoplasmata archaeon]|nr:hypothetical protein [Thermoplasmata archaeon]
METPPSGPAGPFEGATASDSRPPREDPEVLAYLRAHLLPALGRPAPRALGDAVRRAIREEHLSPLSVLSARHRHELLTLMEQLAEGRRRPAPHVLVRLTTVVAAIPAAPDLLGPSPVRPAR